MTILIFSKNYPDSNDFNYLFDSKVRGRYKKIGMSDLPDYSKAGYPKDSYIKRKADFEKYLGKIVSKLQGERGTSSVLKTLDVGCGNGAMWETMEKKINLVYCVDTSYTLVHEGSKRCPFLRFELTSCYDLPFKNNSFDIVVCLGLLHMVSDYRLCISELVRVLKPGGVGLIEFLTAFALLDVTVRLPLYVVTGKWKEILYLRQNLTDGRRINEFGLGISRSPQGVKRVLGEFGAREIKVLSLRFGLLNETNTFISFQNCPN